MKNQTKHEIIQLDTNRLKYFQQESSPLKNSRKEELANWFTHGLATILSVAGAVILFWSLAQLGQISLVKWLSAGIYVATIIVLYSASTLYHYTDNTRWKHYFRITDHCAIYVKIAGTYTPFLVLALPHIYGYKLLFVIWLITIAGIVFKIFFVHKYNYVSTIIYLGMGWLAIFVIRPFYLAVPQEVFLYIMAGGVCFSLGVIFYLLKKLPYSHAIWHLFVMGGSSFHFVAVYQYLIP